MVKRWRGARQRSSVEREVEEELRFHVEGRVAELVAQGVDPAEARRRVLARFGDVERIGAQVREIARERAGRQRRSERMRTLLQDLRYGLRLLRRNPGFALIALLTLALGIGATTAIFSVVDAVMLRPLPYPDADRLVMVFETNAAQGIETDQPSPPNFVDWKAGARSFAGLTAWEERNPVVSGLERPEVVNGASTAADFFRVVGVAPALGRTFLPEEEVAGGPPVAVISHRLMDRLFGGVPGAVGGTVTLNGQPHEVVGVMPPGFDVPRAEIDVWTPVDYSAGEHHRQSRYLAVLGRLAPDATVAGAEAELNAIAERLEAAYPEANTGWRVRLVDARDQVVGGAGRILALVLAAVGFVLLLACVNVANLLLGRATTRGTELAVRAALGAGRGRLRSQLIAETLVLTLLAGAVGVGIAHFGLRAFIALETEAVPRATEIAIDGRILAFAFAVSLLTGLFFGLVPAARGLAGDLSATLREGTGRAIGGRSSERIRRLLIVTEVALALVLVAGAGLALRSLARLQALDPGYRTTDVLAARVSLSGDAYRTHDSKVRYFERLTEQIAAVPGVASAGVTSTLPLDPGGIDFDLAYHAEGHPVVGEEHALQIDYRIISPGVLQTLGMRLLRGRDFSAYDRTESAPVVLVNRTFAERHWPDADPIGRKVLLYYIQNRTYEVVGVVEDTRHRGLAQAPTPQVFVPLAQAEFLFGYMTIILRTRAGATTGGIADAVRDIAIGLDPSEPLYDLQTLESLRGRSTARERLAALVFSAFALLAIALSAAGIYGVISYQVGRRTREIGVRMALGAARSGVIARVVGEAAGLAALGIGIGLGMAVLATRSAQAFLFGVSATDPATFAATALLLLGIAVLAALVPALRAASIAPVDALRYE